MRAVRLFACFTSLSLLPALYLACGGDSGGPAADASSDGTTVPDSNGMADAHGDAMRMTDVASDTPVDASVDASVNGSEVNGASVGAAG